ncbi:MAG: hypothetical protein ACI9LY_000770 [Arenicella sp.]
MNRQNDYKKHVNNSLKRFTNRAGQALNKF